MTSESTGSTSDGLAASDPEISTVLEQGESTLEELLVLLARAQELQIDGLTLAKVEEVVHLKAAADLTLLVEVLSLAGESLQNLPWNVKSALAPSDVDVDKIKLAFGNAVLAGLPAEEIDAARTAMDMELKQLLMHAISATNASSTAENMEILAQNMESLAHKISLAVALELEDALVQEAQKMFNEQLLGTFTAAKMPFLERAVAVAEMAQASVPASLYQWVAQMQHLRVASELPKDNTQSLPAFIKAVGDARGVELPEGVPEFEEVEDKAQHCAMLVLNQSLASEEGHCNTTSPQYLETLLNAIDSAEFLGVSSARLTAAKSRASDCAVTELKAALAATTTDVSRIHAAFNFAERTGVPTQDIVDAWSHLSDEIQARLTAALTAANTGRLTAAEVEELAMAISVCSNLEVNADSAQSARGTYTKLMSGPFNLSDPSPFEALVDMADAADVSVSQKMRSQKAALAVVREALNFPQCAPSETDSLPTVLAAYRLGKDSEVPSFPSIALIATMVQDCAWQKLNDTSPSAQGLGPFLDALEVAKEVGVPAEGLAPAIALAKTSAKDFLWQTLNASLIDPDDVKTALTDAERASVDEFYIKQAVEHMYSVSKERLDSAIAGAQANRTAATMEELGRAVHFADRLEDVRQALATEMQTARDLYTQRLNEPYTGASLELLEASVTYADYAGVSVPKSVKDMAGTLRKVHDAAEATKASAEDLPKIMNLIGEGSDLQNEDLEKLIALAREEAVLELEGFLANANLQKLDEAVDSALLVGLNEQSLLAGTSVLEALGSSP